MKRPRIWLTVFLLLAAPDVIETSAAEREQLTQEMLDERLRIGKITEEFNLAQKWPEAARAGAQLLAIERRIFGDEHEEVLSTINLLATFYELSYDFAPAVKLRREALASTDKLYPAGHWSIVDARVALQEAEAGAKLSDQQLRSLRGAEELYARGVERYQSGEYAQAFSLARQAAAIRKTTLGEQHRAYVSALILVAAVLNHGDNDPRAAPVLQKISDLRARLLGAGHPETASALNDLALNYAAVDAWDKALPLQQQVLDAVQKAYGDEHVNTAAMKYDLATFFNRKGERDKSLPLYREVLETRRKLLGDEHSETIDALDGVASALRGLGHYHEAEPLFREILDARRKVLGPEHLDTVSSMNDLALVCDALGDYVAVEPLLTEALRVRMKLLGAANPDTALSVNNLAHLYQTMGKHAEAERLYLQALEGYRKTVGEEAPEALSTVSNLALLYAAQGDNTRAMQFALRALESRKKQAGEADPIVAHSLNNVAWLYHTMGDYATAEQLYRQAYEILRKTRGEEHSDTATALNNLASLHLAMGDFQKAETIQRQALEIRRKVLGERHPDTATCLNNLAGMYSGMGDAKRAAEYFRKALAIYEEILGPDHPDTATCLSNVATACSEARDYDAAESLLSRACEIRRKTQGEDHPETIIALGNLGAVYLAKDEYEKAEPLLLGAVESQRKTFGERHPRTAAQLTRLASLYRHMGDNVQAESLRREAVRILLEHLENTFAAQSERQKLSMLDELRSTLDAWLSVSRDVQQPADELYAKLLSWKGIVFASEVGLRSLRHDPQMAELFAEYQDVSRQLATVALALPKDFDARAKRDKRLQELTEAKEAIERRLSRLDATFESGQQRTRVTPAELQRMLPRDTVLVDFFEYQDVRPAKEKGADDIKERRLIAFVVQSGQAVTKIELGATAPIAAAIDRWRGCLGAWTGPAAEDPGLELRRVLWEPIAAECGGATTVLVSPDGPLAQLPFAALPGSKPGEFLLHEYAFATVPVPQLLPQLLADVSRKPDPDAAAAARSLLLVGGVNYGAAHGRIATNGVSRSVDRSAALAGFVPLPGTLDEIKNVDGRFHRRYPDGQSQSLNGDQATEAAFRELAPQHRWLHLSTHGFFAPPKLASALDRSTGPADDAAPFARSGVAGFHPGLLSGLAMAGANNRPQPGEDDGILTALEVASLDLTNVDVAVLSACETGLGRVAGGEGVLGLQRAFQVSGAKTVVASLWSVGDRATMLLMQRFYANLWDGNMSKLDALREAQLWLLSDPANKALLADKRTPTTEKHLPPRHWAAFVLSGDWQ